MKDFINKLIYILLLVGLAADPCHAQETTKPSPEIKGIPPLVGTTGSPNDPTLVSQYIRSIFQDSKGNLWFGSAGQIAVRYDGKTLTYFSRFEFFQGNDKVTDDNGVSVHAIAEDKKGNIWFGTSHGAVKYDGKTFRSYTEKNGLTSVYVGRRNILVDKSGTIWVGTNRGVFRYDPRADSMDGQCFSPFDLIPPIYVTDIIQDKEGNIWVASEDNGVFRYDGTSVRNINEKANLGRNYAGGMIQDKKGNFWFVMKDGVCLYDGKTFTEIKSSDRLGGGEVWGIYEERSGIIWITARGSTTRYDPSISISDPKAFTVFTVKDGLNCCVQSMYQDNSGKMWWGTGQGLYRFDGATFYQVKQKGPW